MTTVIGESLRARLSKVDHVRNLYGFSENAEKREVYKRYRGRYLAAAGGELFVANTPEEVERLSHDNYPHEMPHVRYIPR